MKAAVFLSALLMFLQLTGQPAYAASAPEWQDSHAHAARRGPGRPASAAPRRSGHHPGIPTMPTPGAALGLSANRIGRGAAPVHRPATMPLLSATRHRGPNPPAIVGAPNPVQRNTGSLDGRQMHRRP